MQWLGGSGLRGDALTAAQTGRSDDPRTAALLGFALRLVDERGQVSAADVAAVRNQGWSDEQIVETIAQMALALAVPVDFPTVALRPA